jgi:hypothetical protein
MATFKKFSIATLQVLQKNNQPTLESCECKYQELVGDSKSQSQVREGFICFLFRQKRSFKNRSWLRPYPLELR